jgi:hypothetical protein
MPTLLTDAAKSAKTTTAAAKTAKKRGHAEAALTVPQARILRVLADLDAGAWIDGRSLAPEAKVADTWITGFTFKACAANSTPSLCEQGLARAKTRDVDGREERCYQITAAGRRTVKDNA